MSRTYDRELHFMYRMYDAAGDLLYLGIAYEPLARIPGHRRKPWADEVRTVTIEPMGPLVRYEALRVENETIQAERPRHNVVGNGPASKRPEDLERAAVSFGRRMGWALGEAASLSVHQVEPFPLARDALKEHLGVPNIPPSLWRTFREALAEAAEEECCTVRWSGPDAWVQHGGANFLAVIGGPR